MSKAKDAKFSVFDFFKQFPDEQAAIKHLEKERWPDGVDCPLCGSERTRPIKSRPGRHSCNGCRKQFSVRTGAIFQNLKIPLHIWLYAMYRFQSARKGISSIQLSEDTGISQPAAWFMMHRIRESLDPGIEVLSGTVEVDEAYVGGLEKNKHTRKKLRQNWMEGKQVVVGYRERGPQGRIVLRPISTQQQLLMETEILFTVEEGSIIYSDEGRVFHNLSEWYEHYTVNHKRGEYVRGDVTTNGMESVWSILKRAHKGIYHSWSRKHMHRYLNEVAWRLTEGHVDIPVLERIQKMARLSFKTSITHKELTHD